MSHVVDGMIEVTDLEVLERVCKQLGLVFKRGQKTYKWYGMFLNDYHGEDAAKYRFDPDSFGKCEHAIIVPGAAYEIGIARDREGKLRFIYDSWEGGYGIEERLGKGAKLLIQTYAKEVTKKVMLKKGYRVIEEKQGENVVLRCIR